MRYLKFFILPLIILIITNEVYGFGKKETNSGPIKKLSKQFSNNSDLLQKRSKKTEWYPKIDFSKLKSTKGFFFIEGLKGYQQSTEYTCGPAVLLSLAKYYKIQGIEENKKTEMKIAEEAGTLSLEDALKMEKRAGTELDKMVKWLNSHGFKAKIEFEDKGDGSGFKKLQENIEKGIPTIVEWANLMGHWVIVVGIDTRGPKHPWDDVIIFADPYDKYDGKEDGYSYINASVFYWLWYDDASLFEKAPHKIMWRPMITAIPVK